MRAHGKLLVKRSVIQVVGDCGAQSTGDRGYYGEKGRMMTLACGFC